LFERHSPVGTNAVQLASNRLERLHFLFSVPPIRHSSGLVFHFDFDLDFQLGASASDSAGQREPSETRFHTEGAPVVRRGDDPTNHARRESQDVGTDCGVAVGVVKGNRNWKPSSLRSTSQSNTRPDERPIGGTENWKSWRCASLASTDSCTLSGRHSDLRTNAVQIRRNTLRPPKLRTHRPDFQFSVPPFPHSPGLYSTSTSTSSSDVTVPRAFTPSPRLAWGHG
jgi:hypothetical protein